MDKYKMIELILGVGVSSMLVMNIFDFLDNGVYLTFLGLNAWILFLLFTVRKKMERLDQKWKMKEFESLKESVSNR